MKKIKKIIFSVIIVSSAAIMPVMATGVPEESIAGTAGEEITASDNTGGWTGWTEEKQSEAWEVFSMTDWESLEGQMVYGD